MSNSENGHGMSLTSVKQYLESTIKPCDEKDTSVNPQTDEISNIR